jgi:3-oxoacyl-[acyl-carrier-protein] synthase III
MNERQRANDDHGAAPLAVLGIGLDLPPTVSVRDHVARRGGDVRDYRGWERACHARDDEHPSTMGAQALRQALERSGVAPDDLRLVVFTGASRDYVPSWSVSTEIMRLCQASNRCVGLDITAGCLATLAGLDLIQGWLTAHGGGHAAIVAAERWSQTIDHRDPTTATLWAYGDSAGALVVGLDVAQPARVRFLGAEFRSASANNGHVLVPYGGTRAPQAPPGVDPYRRQVSDRPKQELTASYRQGYGDAFAALRDRFGLEPTRMLCNQMSPQLVGMLTELVGMEGRVVATGHLTGHLGGTDIIVGLDTLVGEGTVDGPILVCASAAFGFGTGFLVPAEHR